MEIKLINLKSRPDRLEAMRVQLDKFEAGNYEVFEAFPGGYMGFNKSMFHALKGEGELLLLEDDCVFDGTFLQMLKYKEQLPPDWDMLYLGANVKSRQFKVSENIYTCNDAWTSHAIMYSAKGRQWVNENFKESETTIYDEWINTIGQKHLKRYICKPFLAVQADGWSDIWGANTTYGIKHSEIWLK